MALVVRANHTVAVLTLLDAGADAKWVYTHPTAFSFAMRLGNVRSAAALFRAGAQPDTNWLNPTLLFNGPAFARALANAGLPFEIDEEVLDNAMAVGPAALRLVLDLGADPNLELEAEGGRPTEPRLQRILADETFPSRIELVALPIEGGAPA
jgi:hypothetical protein